LGLLKIKKKQLWSAQQVSMTLHHYERIHKQSSEMIVHSLDIIMVLIVCNNFLYSVKAVGYWLFQS
jgi:hypothetical protein